MSIHLEANPHWYDYLHSLILNQNGSCSFADGGGQKMNGEWKGTWELLEETTIEMDGFKLRLLYTKSSFYDEHEDCANVINISVHKKKEITKFFCGYSSTISDETWVFDKSPCPMFEGQKNNLFNVLEGVGESNTPLVFYKNTKSYKFKDLTCGALRLSHKDNWVVSSVDDDVPVVEEIKNSIREKRTNLNNNLEIVRKYITDNNLPYVFDKSNLSEENIKYIYETTTKIYEEVKDIPENVGEALYYLSSLDSRYLKYYDEFKEVYGEV